MRMALRGLVVSLMLYPAVGSFAADASIQDEYMKRLKAYQTVQPLGEAPFGEVINLYTGELSFRATDVVLEGTGPTIVLGRETTTAQTRELRQMPNAFHDWVLSVPRIESLMAISAVRPTTGLSPTISNPGDYWKVQVVPDDTIGTSARCSQFAKPVAKGAFQVDDWWQGYELITPAGRQQLLKRVPENQLQPTMVDGNGQPMSFPAVTTQHWEVTCLAQTSNQQAGEAFLAIAPDGTKYYFDHLVGDRAVTLVKDVPPDGTVYLQRMLGTMYVSRVEDRFGNTVDYQYTGDRLTHILASDGREVTMTWRADARAIDHITVQPAFATPRTWTYEYTTGTQYGITRTWLSGVVQPDGSHWTYDIPDLSGTVALASFAGCGGRTATQPTNITTVSTVTHPSGLVGAFRSAARWHARSYVAGGCVQDSWDTDPYESIQPVFATESLVELQISGPGIAAKTWTYVYDDPQGSTVADACATAGTCPGTTGITVTGPDGNATRYTHSTRWGATEGKLLTTEIFQGSATLLRRETLNYAAANAGPYPTRVGDAMQGWRINSEKSETLTPLRTRTTQQEQRAFTWQVAADCTTGLCFDAFGKPTKIVRSSAQDP